MHFRKAQDGRKGGLHQTFRQLQTSNCQGLGWGVGAGCGVGCRGGCVWITVCCSLSCCWEINFALATFIYFSNRFAKTQAEYKVDKLNVCVYAFIYLFAFGICLF
jgi:hypothetical protein